MKVKLVQEQIVGLARAQKERLERYAKHLSTDRAVRHFDDNMFELVSKYVKSQKMLLSVTEYLRNIQYSRSNYEYEKIEESIKRFEGNDHPSFQWNENYKAAKAEVIKELKFWRLEQLRYSSDRDLEAALPKKDTHAGFSYILTGLKEKGEYLDGVYSAWSTRLKVALDNGSFNIPILIGSRTQASGAFDSEGNETNTYKKKTRMVSMVDIYFILTEAIIAVPFIKRLCQTSWYAGGKDDVKIRRQLASLRERYKFSVTLDYSSYDQSINAWQIHDAFDCVEAAFNPTRLDKRIANLIRHDFINKIFIDGNMKLRVSKKGVGSGMYFTQPIDTLVNRIMVTTALKVLTKGRYDMMIMGDDIIIFTEDYIDPELISSYIQKNFGITTNGDKSSCTTTDSPVQFLSRTWYNTHIWREPKELLSMMLYPERFRDYRKGADAEMILDAYVRSFDLGMSEFIDVRRFNRDMEMKRAKWNRDKSTKWLSGLMKYRAEYLKSA